MKLYMHPASTTSRPVVQFVAEANLPVELQVIDLFTGEHTKEPFAKINPNKLIPVLEDGDFHLSESSTILKYLADRFDKAAAYPKDLKQRARVNEAMDWFNSNFYRDYGYGLIYPQALGDLGHRRRSDEAQAATVEWGKTKSAGWLAVLDEHILGGKKFLCGEAITIADYFGFAIVHVGELIGCNFKKYPNVDRWLGTMDALPSTAKVYEVIRGFAQQMKGQSFVAV